MLNGFDWQLKNKQNKGIILLTFPEILPYRKYPEISCVEEREKYKAVFNDQFQEYKDLHRDISTTLSKFRELDAAMARLLRDGKSQEVRWVQNKLLHWPWKHSSHLNVHTNITIYGMQTVVCFKWYFVKQSLRYHSIYLLGTAEDSTHFEKLRGKEERKWECDPDLCCDAVSTP